jgi:hypothetical protein
MTDASFGDLLIRMVVSLAVVFGLIAIAYQVMRRRQGGGGTTLISRSRPSRTAVRSGRGGAKPAPRRGLQVLTRVGVGRTTQLVAVRFADEVLLVAASEQGSPNVIGSMPFAAWEAANEAPEERIPIATTSTMTGAVNLGQGPVVSEPAAARGFLEALREATVRRA